MYKELEKIVGFNLGDRVQVVGAGTAIEGQKGTVSKIIFFSNAMLKPTAKIGIILDGQRNSLEFYPERLEKLCEVKLNDVKQMNIQTHDFKVGDRVRYVDPPCGFEHLLNKLGIVKEVSDCLKMCTVKWDIGEKSKPSYDNIQKVEEFPLNKEDKFKLSDEVVYCGNNQKLWGMPFTVLYKISNTDCYKCGNKYVEKLHAFEEKELMLKSFFDAKQAKQCTYPNRIKDEKTPPFYERETLVKLDSDSDWRSLAWRVKEGNYYHKMLLLSALTDDHLANCITFLRQECKQRNKQAKKEPLKAGDKIRLTNKGTLCFPKARLQQVFELVRTPEICGHMILKTLNDDGTNDFVPVDCVEKVLPTVFEMFPIFKYLLKEQQYRKENGIKIL